MMRTPIIPALALLAALATGCTRPEATSRQVTYARPLISPGEQFGALPPPVQHAIRAQTGSAELSQIVPITLGTGERVYAVFLAHDGTAPPLFISPDGSVLADDFSVAVGAPADDTQTISGRASSQVSRDDLPTKVVQALQDREPHGRIAHIETQPWGESTIYVITFQDPALHPRLFIQADGTVWKQKPD